MVVLLMLACDDTDSATPDTTTQVDTTDTRVAPDTTSGGNPPPPPSEPGRHGVTVVETRQIIPGPGLPGETPPLNSNNNLDVVRHSDGRIYLAWRTSPDHFAGPETVIYVVSTTDEQTWDYEATFTLDTDLREPRFLSWDGKLFLYLSELGADEATFEPQGVLVSERLSDGSWSTLESIYQPGFLAWRTRVERGTPYMVGYFGGANIYRFNGEPLTIELLTTTDGRTWTGVNPDDPVVSTGGGSETDFTIGDDGTLYGIIRNEAGDDTGWGSKVCKAPASDITDWTCTHDPKKYDSPLMFWYDGEAYLIGRRNVTPTGNYELEPRGSDPTGQTVLFQYQYVNARKRCAIWRYVQDEDRIAYITDLPSAGDTCFPALLETETPGTFVVYNYSSDFESSDPAWNEGQKGQTNIYRHVVRFE